MFGTFSWTVALVFSKPALEEAPMFEVVSFTDSPAFFPPCIFNDPLILFFSFFFLSQISFYAAQLSV